MSKGRPRKSEKEKRCHVFRIRLNDYEWEMVQHLRTVDGLRLATRIRNLITELYFEHPPSQPSEFEKMVGSTLAPALLDFAKFIDENSENL